MTKAEIFNEIASHKMVQWDLQKFLRDYPTLTEVIMESMDKFAEEQALDKLIQREREIINRIIQIQDLEKEIEEYKILAEENVPELKKRLKERRI